MDMEQPTTRQSSLAECKIKVQHLRRQMEQHEKDYAALLKQKQDYFYENLAWIVLLAGALLLLEFLNYAANTVPTGNMLIPFGLGLQLVSIFLAARVIYFSRHFIGMKDEKSGRFMRFKTLIEDQLVMKENLRKLLARAEEELAQMQAAADAAAEEEKRTMPEEESMVMRWDQQEPQTEETGTLSDTARLIREALEKDE